MLEAKQQNLALGEALQINQADAARIPVLWQFVDDRLAHATYTPVNGGADWDVWTPDTDDEFYAIRNIQEGERHLVRAM